MKRLSGYLLAAFLTAGFIDRAAAAPLAADSVVTGAPNYNAAAINGQGPAVSGFTGTWTGDANVSASASGLSAIANGYAAAGGAFSETGASTVTRSFDPAVVSVLSTAGEVWFSFLMRTSHQGGTNTVRLVASTSIAASIGQRLSGVQIKLQDSGGATGGSSQLNGGGTTVAGTGEAFTVGDTGTGLWPVNTTFLMVGRVIINRNASGLETLQFWKLADATAFNPGTPFLTSSRDIITPAFPGFTGIQIQGNQSGDTYDEIRVGTSPSDVIPTSTPGLPAAFSPGGNPALGWAHGMKTTAQASALTLFDVYAAADATAPANRWHDVSPETAFAGVPLSNSAAFTWYGVATDWESGRLYHAWRSGQTAAITSRLTVTSAGDYDLSGVWRSHTVAGTAAGVSIVVNGTTVYSGTVNGFAGTVSGTPVASGPAPFVNGIAHGVHLAAGDQVDFVTVPGAAQGNVSLTVTFAPGTVPPLTTSTVIINEFCAGNSFSLRDEDGAASDWIELYNGTGASVDLTNWSLTDDIARPAKWVFPPRTIVHGEHLVIFASEKDSSKRPGYHSASELHTNFKLSAGGEYLAVVNAARTVVESFAPAFPAQFTDITFGHGSNAVTGYMQPTPGSVNGPATTVPPAVPAFSVPSGLFTGTLSVNITGQLAGHTVRYTIDGTEPTLSNGLTFVTGTPVSLTASTTLRARFYSSGVGGPLADAAYILRGTTAAYGITPAAFAGSLPILVIDSPSSGALTSTAAVPARYTLIDRSAVDQRARLTDTPAFTTRGSIKVRGQYSSSFPKKGYAVEFWDAGDRDKALPVLGMPE
ncbi:MAG TPA: lamin tail domain-containing protein, partial [Verrucomicrobiales bacterium]|nr:lamin tail domain-containing protein [Verrucomicrobiales bacterium]